LPGYILSGQKAWQLLNSIIKSQDYYGGDSHRPVTQRIGIIAVRLKRIHC